MNGRKAKLIVLHSPSFSGLTSRWNRAMRTSLFTLRIALMFWFWPCQGCRPDRVFLCPPSCFRLCRCSRFLSQCWRVQEGPARVPHGGRDISRSCSSSPAGAAGGGCSCHALRVRAIGQARRPQHPQARAAPARRGSGGTAAGALCCLPSAAAWTARRPAWRRVRLSSRFVCLLS